MMIEPSAPLHPAGEAPAAPRRESDEPVPARAAGDRTRRPCPFPPRLEIAPLTIPRPSAPPGERLPIC